MPASGNASGVPNIPSLPKDGKEFFNAVMGQIEKDLTIPDVHKLKERYANETPEDHQKRMERYRTAIIEYRKRSVEYFTVFREQVRSFGRDLKHSVEDNARGFEQAKLEHLESLFSA
ncbi:hypothetical protein FJZ28_03705 [Candidatus Peregrinibacteria bacterium]|nr:hypothetical protein [Candidatus Peregrinibacteria bacterium]